MILANNEKKAEEGVDKVQKSLYYAKTELDKAAASVGIEAGKCFYINSLGQNGKADSGYVLEVSSEDKYAPKKTGVYNIGLRKKAIGNKAQMWSWNDADGTLSPLMFPTKALMEGSNNNMIVYKNRGMEQQKF